MIKYLIPIFLFMLCIGISNDEIIVRARVTYIEPFPFAVPLQGDAAIAYAQPAWIRLTKSVDSMAVLFGYRISRGDDITKKILIGKTYEFKLIKYQSALPVIQGEEKIDSVNEWIMKLPNINLIDSSKCVKAKEYWIVLSATEIK